MTSESLTDVWPPNFPVTYDHLSSEAGRGHMADRIAHNLATVVGIEGSYASELPVVFDYATLRVSSGIGAGPPNRIAPSSLNEYGPSTRDAVVLTGANKLLEPVAEAFGQAVETDWYQGLGPVERLHAYVALMSGIVAAQPVLLHAGLIARALQREEMDFSPALPLSPSAIDLPMTRCEIGQVPTIWDEHLHPHTLNVVDGIVPLLGLERPNMAGDMLTDTVARALTWRVAPLGRTGEVLVEGFRDSDEVGRQTYKASVNHTLFARTVTLAVLETELGKTGDELRSIETAEQLPKMSALALKALRVAHASLLAARAQQL